MIQQYKEKVMEWLFKGKRHKAAANNYSNKAKVNKQAEVVYNSKGAKVSYAYTATPSVPRPEDTKDMSKLSVVLMKQSWLNHMSSICQPPAGGSEFQIHYRAFIIRVKNTTNELIVSIPTYFYNFDQKVTTGSVAYHLDEVDKQAEAGMTVSQTKLQEVWNGMPLVKALQQIMPNAEVVFEESNSGSLHRHPGRFGFSSIDYDKNPSNPGVIYREAEATNKVHTDSVIYLGANTEIYTTETRILNLVQKDGGVEGTYCQIPTITYLLDDMTTTTTSAVPESADTLAELLHGMIDSVNTAADDNSKGYQAIVSMNAKKGYTLVNELLKDFKDLTYTPNMENVLASRITSAYSYSGYSGYQGYTGYTPSKAKSVHSKSLWYDDDDDYFDYEDCSYFRGHIPKESNEITVTKNPYSVGSKAWAAWNQTK